MMNQIIKIELPQPEALRRVCTTYLT